MFLTMLTIQVFYANIEIYDSAYNDLLSAASTMITLVQNELHAGKP